VPPLFRVVVLGPKGFPQRRRHPAGGGWMGAITEGTYRRNSDGWRKVRNDEKPQLGDERHPAVRLMLYGLRELQHQSEICIAEGERDVQTLRALGFVATTNPMGAGKWRKEYVDQLRAAGADTVNVFRDGDATGERHACIVEESCAAGGLRVRPVRLPDNPQDVSAWVAVGHSADELRAVIAASHPV